MDSQQDSLVLLGLEIIFIRNKKVMLGLEIISNPNKMILLELEMADRSRSRSRSYRNFDRSFFWIAINDRKFLIKCILLIKKTYFMIIFLY
jgi:hypothetical protein